MFKKVGSKRREIFSNHEHQTLFSTFRDFGNSASERKSGVVLSCSALTVTRMSVLQEKISC